MSLRGFRRLHRNNVVCRVQLGLHLFLGFERLRGSLPQFVVYALLPDIFPH
jgi:hypothetical protein